MPTYEAKYFLHSGEKYEFEASDAKAAQRIAKEHLFKMNERAFYPFPQFTLDSLVEIKTEITPIKLG